MVGHGSPNTSRPLGAGRGARLPAARRTGCAATPGPLVVAAVQRRGQAWVGWRHLFRLGLLLAVLLVWLPLCCAEESIRLRILWGGGAEKTWYGSISLSNGKLTAPSCLGVEADEPGSMWLDGDRQLVIQQRSPRSFDGVDLTAVAPLDAKLTIQLAAAEEPSEPFQSEIPLSGLLAQLRNEQLDRFGNRLLVHRAPGDALRVHFQRDSLIFSPGEVFRIAVEPTLLPVPAGGRVQIRLQLVPARTQRELWSLQKTFDTSQPAAIPVEVPLPVQEGAYDLLISAVPLPHWQQAVRQPLAWRKPVAERSVQLLVLQASRPAAGRPAQSELVTLVPLDPANPRWWDIVGKLPQLPRIQRLWKTPLGSGHSEVWRHSLGELVRLAPSGQSPDVSWEAYTLPISQPGKPHVLEVEFPSDVQQTLGISILEPNAAGALMPIGLDSAIDVQPERLVGGSPQWLRHRLIFWPRTSSPLLLMTNCQARLPAVYGKIRLLGGWEHLPPASPAPLRSGRRLLAAYYDRPLFHENFGGSEALDAWSGHSLDDWLTFYEGGTRLIEYLHHVGYNGLMISVMADGSSIYPSALLEPTPRYDKGTLFATGQDPIRKDVLEMLFRLFDREQFTLIPALDFAAPLPSLEAAARRGGPAAESLRWIGPEGKPMTQLEPPYRGLAPYYNLLDPDVQTEMLAVIREVAARYGHHPSFGGVAIQLSARGYAQLPPPEWGLDDRTISRFEQHTGIKVPGAGPERYAERAAFLLGPRRAAWLHWRAETLAKFYDKVQSQLWAIRPDARVYLAGSNVLAGSDSQYQLRPALTRRVTMYESLLRVGLDVQHYHGQGRPVLLRPERVTPASLPAAHALSLEMEQLPDRDRCFQGMSVPGSLFFHQPQEVRVASLDGRSPFQPCYAWLVVQAAQVESRNRQRFVRSLAALDSQVLVDGGWLLPIGQEESVRSLVVAYRNLPAIRFRTVAGSIGQEAEGASGDGAPGTADAPSSQPVLLRKAVHADRTFVYALNDSPFPVVATVRIEAPPGCRMEELSGLRKVPPPVEDSSGSVWTIHMQAYDFLAVQFSSPSVALRDLRVHLPPGVEQALQERIRRLGSRTSALRNPTPLPVLTNPGFEKPPAGEELLPDWAVTKRAGVLIQADRTHSRSGQYSARITSTGPVACLVSRPFPAPNTGRLTMSVWLRVAEGAEQPPLRLAIEGRVDGRPYYRYAEVGALPAARQAGHSSPPVAQDPPVVPIGSSWTQFVFAVDDLLLEGVSQVRVRFDLMGAGEVWVDDVQLFDLAFGEIERRELAKLITVAEYQLQTRRFADCARLLDGYWPRFLEAFVPLEPAPPVAQTPSEPETAPPPRTGVLDRLKGILPESLRF